MEIPSKTSKEAEKTKARRPDEFEGLPEGAKVLLKFARERGLIDKEKGKGKDGKPV